MLVEILLALIGHTGDVVGKDFRVKATFIGDDFIPHGEAVAINRLLKIGKLYQRLDDFVKKIENSNEGGELICRGFCNGLRELLRKYHEKICYVEQLALRNPKLTVGKVKFHLTEFQSIFEALSTLVLDKLEKKSCKGCQIIGLVHHAAHFLNSDPSVTLAFESILSHCHIVWLNLMESWMCYGLLTDSYGEFFIKERAYNLCVMKQDEMREDFFSSMFSKEKPGNSILSEYEWKAQFRLRHEMLPTHYVSTPTAEKILFVGKAMRVLQRVQSSSVSFDSSGDHTDELASKYELMEGKISASILKLKQVANRVWTENSERKHRIQSYLDEKQIEAVVTDIYSVIAKALWKLVMRDAKLVEHLNIVRQFLLLGRGEFFRSFIERSRNLMSSPPRPSIEHAENTVRAGAWREASIESGIDEWPEFEQKAFENMRIILHKVHFTIGETKQLRSLGPKSATSGKYRRSNLDSHKTSDFVLVGEIKCSGSQVNFTDQPKPLDLEKNDNKILTIFGHHGGIWLRDKICIEKGFETSVALQIQNDHDSIVSVANQENLPFKENNALKRRQKTSGSFGLVLHHDTLQGPTALGVCKDGYGIDGLENYIAVLLSFSEKQLIVKTGKEIVKTVEVPDLEYTLLDIRVLYELVGEKVPKWAIKFSINSTYHLQVEVDIPKVLAVEHRSGRAWVGLIGGVDKGGVNAPESRIQVIGWDFKSHVYNEQSTEFDSWNSLLSLRYDVHWPVQLILSQDLLESYGAVFQFLLAIKRVGDSLKASWAILNQTKFKKQGKNPWLHNFLRLRASMEFLINNLQYHIQVDVVDALTSQLKEKLSNASNFELIVKAHREYVRAIITKSFLHNKVVKNSLDTVLRRCLFFCGLVSRFDREFAAPKEEDDSTERKMQLLCEDFQQVSKAFTRDATFLYALLTRINSDLLARIDFNGYFSKLAKS